MKMIFMHVGVRVFSFLENKHNNKTEKKKTFKLQRWHHGLDVRWLVLRTSEFIQQGFD